MLIIICLYWLKSDHKEDQGKLHSKRWKPINVITVKILKWLLISVYIGHKVIIKTPRQASF